MLDLDYELLFDVRLVLDDCSEIETFELIEPLDLVYCSCLAVDDSCCLLATAEPRVRSLHVDE